MERTHLPNRFMDKIRLRQRFAARKRHAATALRQEISVFHHASRQFQRSHSHATETSAALWANMRARSANRTAFPSMRTDSLARPAMDAFLQSDQHLRLERLPLRILAPCTAQRAALQEHSRPHARSVMDAELAYFKYDAACFLFHGMLRKTLHPSKTWNAFGISPLVTT